MYMKRLWSWRKHLVYLNPLVELFAGEEAERQSGLLEIGAVLVGLLGDLGRLVVADVRVERRDEHERLLRIHVDARRVRTCLTHTMSL